MTAWPGFSTDIFSRPAHGRRFLVIEILVTFHDQCMFRPLHTDEWILASADRIVLSVFLANADHNMDRYHIASSSPADYIWHKRIGIVPVRLNSFGIIF